MKGGNELLEEYGDNFKAALADTYPNLRLKRRMFISQ